VHAAMLDPSNRPASDRVAPSSHAEPSNISTWHMWWELDIWPLVVHMLYLAGTLEKPPETRHKRATLKDASLAVRRGRADINTTGAPVSFWANQTSPMPIWVQWAILVTLAVGVARWRARARRATSPDRHVTAMLTAILLILVLQAFWFMLTDPTLAPTLPWHALSDPNAGALEWAGAHVSLAIVCLCALPCSTIACVVVCATALVPAALILSALKVFAHMLQPLASLTAWSVHGVLCGRAAKPHWSRV